MSKTILITGKNGQLGQHLIKFFQDNHPEHKIIATIRHKSYDKQDFIFDDSKVKTELLDLIDSVSIEECIRKNKPDYLFNTSANAFVGESWLCPENHAQVNSLGVVRLLEAIRKFAPECRFVNLGTSEELGCTLDDMGKGSQDENTKIEPKSPYACSKAYARYMIDVYRESYKIYAVQPWTFNFESKLRGEKYVTRKITKGIGRIYRAIKNNEEFSPIELGNLNSYRSWQHASDVASALWLVVNQEFPPKPYVISENDTHSIREFVERAFLYAGINGKWWNINSENPLTEEFILYEPNGLPTKKKIVLVSVNEKFFRPHDVSFLYGNSNKIRQELGWKPQVPLDDLISEMVQWDINNP